MYSPIRDLISGAIMAATSVPQLIAYAETAGYAGYRGLATAGPPLLVWGLGKFRLLRVKNKGNQSRKRGRKRPKYQAPWAEHPETSQELDDASIHANHLEALICDGELAEETLDDLVREVLTAKYFLGLFKTVTGLDEAAFFEESVTFVHQIKVLSCKQFIHVSHRAAPS